jgi:REP element-mobilizing transposase RayT
MYDPAFRYWLLTWTTYGTWLPGEDRGFVSPVREHVAEKWQRQNVRGTNYSRSMPGLKTASQSRLKCAPIFLQVDHAKVLMRQFHETATYRGWHNVAIAIMGNHIHLLVSVANDPGPDVLLKDFKSYGSRILNLSWGKPLSGTWWTESGSKRKKATYQAIVNAVRYVANQDNPLVVWIHPEWQCVLKVS